MTWATYRRAGTVTAQQRASPWTWTARSGETLCASEGDWQVSDGDGDSWSVDDQIFRATYERVEGDVWRRRGVVIARAAIGGETIDTLEGPVTDRDGEWVVQGEAGEQWPVPADAFARRYRGPI